MDSKKRPLENVPQLEIPSRAAWRAWLLDHHASGRGVWVVTYKAGTGQPRPTYDDLVEEALCFGWIDSLPRKLDEARSMLYMAPRKSGSPWSGLNKRRLERLIAASQMHPAGLAAVERAQSDGSWSSYDAAEALEIPSDLAAALAAEPEALNQFEAFPPSVRKGILWRILEAKTPPTRARRIAEVVAARDGKRYGFKG